MKILSFAVPVLLIAVSCTADPATNGLCSVPTDGEIVKTFAMSIIRDRDLKPDWTSIERENVIYEESDPFITYFVNFDAPPIGYLMITMDCSGAPVDVIINQWGTLN